MAKIRFDYKLRLQCPPDRLTMDRLAEYMRVFAQLLGVENSPVFKGIRKESTGILAKVPEPKAAATRRRLLEAKGLPESKPGTFLRAIEPMLGLDRIRKAELENESGKVIYLFKPQLVDEIEPVRIYQTGTVDGVVTGIKGADDTMHLYLRDRLGRDLNIVVRDEGLGRELALHFRLGFLRLRVRGMWVRAQNGWHPESQKCSLEDFEVLEDAGLKDIFETLSKIKGNAWHSEAHPLETWKAIREGE